MFDFRLILLISQSKHLIDAFFKSKLAGVDVDFDDSDDLVVKERERQEHVF